MEVHYVKIMGLHNLPFNEITVQSFTFKFSSEDIVIHSCLIVHLNKQPHDES